MAGGGTVSFAAMVVVSLPSACASHACYPNNDKHRKTADDPATKSGTLSSRSRPPLKRKFDFRLARRTDTDVRNADELDLADF